MSAIVDAAESLVALAVGSSLILYFEKKEVSVSTSTGCAGWVQQPCERATTVKISAKSWSESEGPNVECVDHQVS